MSLLNLIAGYMRLGPNYERLMWFVRESFNPFFTQQINPEYYRPMYEFAML